MKKVLILVSSVLVIVFIGEIIYYAYTYYFPKEDATSLSSEVEKTALITPQAKDTQIKFENKLSDLHIQPDEGELNRLLYETGFYSKDAQILDPETIETFQPATIIFILKYYTPEDKPTAFESFYAKNILVNTFESKRTDDNFIMTISYNSDYFKTHDFEEIEKTIKYSLIKLLLVHGKIHEVKRSLTNKERLRLYDNVYQISQNYDFTSIVKN